MVLTGTDADFVENDLTKAGILFGKKYFQAALLIRRSPSGIPLPPLDPESITDMLKEQSLGASCFTRRSSLGCLLLFNYETKEDLADLTTALLAHIPDGVLSLGGETTQLKEVASSCTRAITISQYRSFADGYRIIRYEEHAKKMGLYYYPFKMEYAFGALLQAKKCDEALELIRGLVGENTSREDVAPEGVRNLLINIAMNAARAAGEATDYDFLPIIQLASMPLEEFIEYMNQAIVKICEAGRGESGESQILVHMREYVDKAIRNPGLSLDMVADAFGVSPSFVSKLFKEKGGKNFNQYINEHRIEMAKPILLNLNHTVLEVARQVGYENDVTFRRQFKQITGLTPGAYRMLSVE
jgi:AraC-like DNA-binding protein